MARYDYLIQYQNAYIYVRSGLYNSITTRPITNAISSTIL